MDSTKPASRSKRRCLDTVGCGIPSRRSISPTDRCDETRRPNIARRFGSAMISNADSTLFIYSTEHILVKAYKGRARRALSSCRIECHTYAWLAFVSGTHGVLHLWFRAGPHSGDAGR